MKEVVREINFRELIPEISDTGYLTHSIHYYPAKFIPQAVKYCILNFTKEGDIVIDPFAGSGTVGLEAALINRSTYLLDLNPMLNHIIPLKIPKLKSKLSYQKLYTYLETTLNSKEKFVPSWKNINYWYPDVILNRLQKIWGGLKSLDNSIYKLILEASLIKISKRFSYAEHRVPKLFRSKRKIEQLDSLLRKGWSKLLLSEYYSLATLNLKRVNETIDQLKKTNVDVFFKGGVDSSSYNYQQDDRFDLLISSPPYLQAQEYIRTAKLDLFWLGYTEDDIKALSKLEIPYRKADMVISTPTLDKIRLNIERKDLLNIVDSYFCHTLNSLRKAMTHLKKEGVACIFIGSPRVDIHEVEIWKIFKEYFGELGFEAVDVLEDKIKTRQLFGSRKNKNPEGMKSEFMLIMRKL